MTRDKFFTYLFVLVPIMVFFSHSIIDSDFFIWVQIGIDTIFSGKLITHDTYSYLPTKEMVYPAWGTSILYALLYKLTNIEAVSLIHKLALLTFSLLVVRTYLKPHQIGYSNKNIVLLIFATYGASSLYCDRPAMLVIIPMFFVYKKIDLKSKLCPKDLLELFLWTTLWINLHGSAFIILILLAWKITATSVVLKKIEYSYIWALILTTCALNINPFFFKVWGYALETRSVSKQRLLSEWLPTFYPIFDEQSLVYLILLLYLGFEIVRNKSRLISFLTSPYIPLVIMGVMTYRHVALAFLFLFPFLCNNQLALTKCSESMTKTNKLTNKINQLVLFALVLLTTMMLPFWKEKVSFFLPESKRSLYYLGQPEAEIAMIKKLDPHAKARIFNQYELGSYLIFNLKNKIFMDTRNIIYHKQDSDNYNMILSGKKGMEDKLNHYFVDYILMRQEKKTARFIQSIQRSSSWQTLSKGKRFFLAKRSDKAH
ncbi:MAG: hypothetical protein ISR65_05925 [Bacteriovoracaceae bacterium]|nr:hypothetical protein [Bacteriovoracaceae bacterium]